MTPPADPRYREEWDLLHELRSAAGEQVLSPILRLQSLLLDGKLPGTRRCGCCGQETDGRVQVVLDCDRATVKAGGPSRTDVAAGCLLSFGMGLILHMLRRNAPTKEFGQDVRATVPLPMCDSCRPALANSNTLRRSLLTIPEYAALLDQYRKENATLKERLASYEDSSSNHVADSGVMLGTRPTITQGEAARRAGVSVATANRYLNTGYWQGVQMSGNRWFVFADQALKKKKV
jgi:hypothetical protein